MIAPYFNAWLSVRKETDGLSSMVEDFRKAWLIMKHPTRVAIVLFLASDLSMIAFSVVAALNMSLLTAYGVCFGLFSALATGADRAATSFHRENPGFSAKRTAEFAKRLRAGLRKVGLRNPGQVEYVRDESARLLERKERRGASIVRSVVDVVVLFALASVFNLVIALLGRGAPLNLALLLLAMAVLVSASIVVLAYLLWRMRDRIGSYPIPMLREFVDDLAALLVYEAGSPIPRREPLARAASRRALRQC